MFCWNVMFSWNSTVNLLSLSNQWGGGYSKFKHIVIAELQSTVNGAILWVISLVSK